MVTNESTETLPSVLTVKEMLETVPLPRSTVYRLLRENKIPSVRLGKRILIPRAAVVRLLTPEEAA